MHFLLHVDVENKVIHVVNRSPPQVTTSANTATTSNVSNPPATTASSRPSVSMSSVPSNMIGEVMNSVMAGLPPGKYIETSRYHSTHLWWLDGELYLEYHVVFV